MINPFRKYVQKQPKHVEGEEKDFGVNDRRKLTKTAGGVERWISVDETKGAPSAPVSTQAQATQLKGGGEQGQQPVDLKLSPARMSVMDKFIEDNPFLNCESLQDIEDKWFEEMLKIKSDKKWYENEIIKLKHKLKLATSNQAKKELHDNIKKFTKVVDDNNREDTVNLQRVAFEYFRLFKTVEVIQQTNPGFDYNTFITEDVTLEEIEQLKEPQNV